MNAKFSIASVWTVMLIVIRNILMHILVSNMALMRFTGVWYR